MPIETWASPTCNAPSPQITYLGKNQQVINSNNYCLTFIGNPCWLINGKAIRPANTQSITRIIELFEQSVELFLSSLRGHFAFVLTHEQSKKKLAVSDRIGVHRLYWFQSADGNLNVSNSLSRLHQAHDSPPELCPTALYNYMYFHMVPSPFTIYPNIEKLAPGHYALCENGNLSINSYWVPEFSETCDESIDNLSSELHRILSESVADCIGDESHFATFLSGGLDSSTVTGVASNLARNEAIHSYSIGFNAKEYDETPFARETAKHFSTKHYEYFVTPEDIVSAIPRIAETYDEPFGNSSALPTYYCAKVAAENGVKLMLAGDGGDELFAGNTRYASQRHYQYYLTIPKVIRRKLFDHIINALPASFPLAKKAQNYIKQAEIPLPDRLQIYNFLHRHDPLEIFNPDFLNHVDIEAPLRLQRTQFTNPDTASDLNRMLYLDWQFTLADNDLRKVSSMCELAGVKVAYPLLTNELVDFSSKIPSSLKLRRGELRYFFRHAMKDFLPQATLQKSKHGFGLPFGLWLKDYKPLHDLAYDSLEKLKSRHYFNSKFIDKARKLHESTHAGYYGELIWIMMMLELWISNHHDNKH